MAKSNEETMIECGSGNVFADLGLPNPEERLANAGLASAIQDAIEARGLTQVEAAKILGVDQPKVSKIVRGRLSEFSTERLLTYLVQLGLDVDIVIHRAKPETSREGSLFASSATQPLIDGMDSQNKLHKLGPQELSSPSHAPSYRRKPKEHK